MGLSGCSQTSRAERAILLPIVAAAAVAGLLLGGLWDAPVGALGLFVIASVMLILVSASLRMPVLPALALAAMLAGLLRAGFVGPPGAGLEPHHGIPGAAVRGVVADDPADSGTTSTFRFSVDRYRPGPASAWIPISGDIRVTAAATSELARSREPPLVRYGDRLELSGRLEAPEWLDDFDFPAYLERQGITTVMAFPDVALLSEGGGNPSRRWLTSNRRRMARALANVVSEPQAAFGQSILLGVREDLPDEMVEDFRRTGASHLLAISGLHVGIMLVLAASAGAFIFGRRRQLYLLMPLVAIWLYALLSGASPSAIRAAVMGTMYISAILVGRPRSLTPSLALAAALMALIDPRVLYSVSFQLSFAAMLGIAVYQERLSDLLREKLGHGPEVEGVSAAAIRALIGAVGITIAATVATAPLVGFYFQRLPLIGVPTTLLTMPAVPLALVAHAATAVVGLVSEVAALPFGWLAWGISSYVTGAVSLLARVPGASISVGDTGPLLVWSYYGVLVVAAVLSAGRVSWRTWGSQTPRIFRTVAERSPPWQVVAVAVTVAVLVWIAVLSRPSGNLRVMFADVGQGDMTVITTPGGHRIVVDGGPDGARAAQVLGRGLPFWERTIDLIVLSHPHSDHVAGLNELLRRYEVRNVVERRQRYQSPGYTSWLKLIDSEGARVIEATPGMRLAFSDGVSIQVLGPPEPLLSGTASDVDNASVILRVVYGSVSFLLTGDLFVQGEAWLTASGQQLESDVLKVPHHGSRSSSTLDLLRAVSPSAAVISAGRENRFGHPHQVVVDRLRTVVSGSGLFVTSANGSVTFDTDGRSLWVDTERSE